MLRSIRAGRVSAWAGVLSSEQALEAVADPLTQGNRGERRVGATPGGKDHAALGADRLPEEAVAIEGGGQLVRPLDDIPDSFWHLPPQLAPSGGTQQQFRGFDRGVRRGLVDDLRRDVEDLFRPLQALAGG